MNETIRKSIAVVIICVSKNIKTGVGELKYRFLVNKYSDALISAQLIRNKLIISHLIINVTSSIFLVSSRFISMSCLLPFERVLNWGDSSEASKYLKEKRHSEIPLRLASPPIVKLVTTFFNVVSSASANVNSNTIVITDSTISRSYICFIRP